MYFECNIDSRIPQFYHPEIYSKLVSTVALIHQRTDKLNAALTIALLADAVHEEPLLRVLRKLFSISQTKSLTP